MVKKEMVVQRELRNSQEAVQCVQIATQYRASLCIEYETYRVNPKSMMGMLLLGLGPGMKITISGEGEDEERAVAHLESYLS